MADEPSKTQIDKLGERLKKGNIAEDDLRFLDEYRRSFSRAYEIVVEAVRDQLGLEPTGRPSKSTTSISEKLRRESIRLTQIQDISGCRLVVQDLAAQDQVVESLGKLFHNVTVVDRRKQPSYGYRAVHVIAKYEGKLVEIQVRTTLQHLWAEQSEKFSDIVDPAIKYGGGDKEIQKLLTVSSAGVARLENLETSLLSTQQLLQTLVRVVSKPEDKQEIADTQKTFEDLQSQVIAVKKVVIMALQETIDHAAKLIGENNDISN